ncbi:hypothetical protein [Streptomyces galbus]|uniref:hypothetical protein n=1 Tax=Streptomyces galbus TaxID=33898 RepID=UPI00144A8C82|nr:hypothetical protein [Streptomyces galbus]GHD32315.1 hypothetical protein GCM10010335_23960 [Streptomyces galbus]
MTGDAAGPAGWPAPTTGLIVHVDRRGLFGGHRWEADVLAGIFDGERTRLLVHGPT